MIVGASDRMITAGDDIEYEPEQTKAFSFHPHVVALVSGDASEQFEICLRIKAAYLSRNIGPHVGAIAQAYANEFAALRRRRAEESILQPLGLDIKKFVDGQHKLPSESVKEIMILLQQSGMEDAVIITGMDSTGPHIYVVSDPGQAVMQTGVGFAAVGIGNRHAESQFMFARYSSQSSFARALFLTYSAKKRAQTAPGVGEFTDMFTIIPAPNMGFQFIPHPVVGELDAIYRDTLTKAKEAEEESQRKIEKLMADIAAQVWQQRVRLKSKSWRTEYWNPDFNGLVISGVRYVTHSSRSYASSLPRGQSRVTMRTKVEKHSDQHQSLAIQHSSQTCPLPVQLLGQTKVGDQSGRLGIDSRLVENCTEKCTWASYSITALSDSGILINTGCSSPRSCASLRTSRTSKP